MPKASAAKQRLLTLCAENQGDPFEILGLISLHALAAGDLAEVALWKVVADRLRARGALPEGEHGVQNLDVLIVDDEPVFLDTIEALLKAIGITRISRASSGDDARRFLSTPGCTVNCVLSDIAMDHGSGLELLQAVRDGRERLADPATFVLVTGLESEDIRAAARRMGANGFLTKPVTPERLRDAIHPRRMRDIFQPIQPLLEF